MSEPDRYGRVARHVRARPRFERLLVLIAASFVFSAVDADWARSLTVLINVLLVVVAFRLTGLRTSDRVFFVFALIPVVGLVAWLLTDGGSSYRAVPAVAEFIALVVVAVALIRAVLARTLADTQTVVGAITAYVVMGMAMSWLYLALDTVDNDQLSLDPSDTASYAEFSFVVLTTLGFGNQLPTAALSGRIVVVEALLGQIFLATFVARLVSRHGMSSGASGDDDAEESAADA